MTREDRKKLRAYDKEMKAKIDLMHRIRTSPFSFNVVGRICKPETAPTKGEIRLARAKSRRLYANG